MGTEALWVPLALSALGAGASYINTRNTESKQNDALTAQLQTQQRNQDAATARTKALIANQAAQTPAPQKAADMAQFTQQLAANQPQALNPLKSVGAVSQAYQQSGANAAQGITNYGNNLADLTSSINAPGQQRQANQKNLDDYSSDLSLIKRKAQGDDYLAQLKEAAIKRSPGLDVLSGLAGGAAGALSGGAGASLLGGGSSASAASPYGYMLNGGAAGSNYDYLNSVLNQPSGYSKYLNQG